MFNLSTDLENTTEVTVSMVFPNGKTIVWHRDKNRIMNDAKAEVLSSLYSNTYTQNRIVTFKVGSGGTNTVGGADVKPVLGTATDLYQPYDASNPTIGYPDVLSAPQVTTDGLEITYSFAIPDTGLVGQYINEVGMFKENGEIFNMKTFPSIFKVSGFSLVFTWKIRYK